jgi:catechol 2,3-dioxygenase-like lactoylglutathione lyase family enzyme
MNSDPVEGWEYIHLDMPEGDEDIARQFYARLLGLREILKPRNPASHRGVWFRCGSMQLHLGGAPDWPARPAVPLLPVPDLRGTVDAILQAGYAVGLDSQSSRLFARAIVVDPFGNRIELMQTMG